MLPDRVSNPGPLTYESGALPRFTPQTHLCMIQYYLHLLRLLVSTYIGVF